MKTGSIATKNLSLVVILIIILSAGVVWHVQAQSDDFVLKVEKHWDTYTLGGTCTGGGHNLAIADIDGDGTLEMVSGGSSYYLMDDGITRTNRTAPLRIWTWNGESLTLEKAYNWPGSLSCVYAADCNGDGKMEILTGGNVIDENNNTFPSLRIWSWDGQTLNLVGKYDGITVGGSIYVGDIDKDGKTEIVTVTGRAVNIDDLPPRLSVFRWDGTNINLITSVDCDNQQEARMYSVAGADLNGDGITEIVTAGYLNDLKNSSGLLRVWNFDGANFSLKDSTEWRMISGNYSVDVASNPMGNTVATQVKIGDVDGDGTPELVTTGFTFDNHQVLGQLRTWNWTDGVLKLEKSAEWSNLDITQATAISINDVDGDGKTDIVTSGVTAGYGSFVQDSVDKERAELKVWDGATLTLKQAKDWIVGDGVAAWSDGTGDLDNDGTIEIVTIGCMYKYSMCDPDMRIWTLPNASTYAAFPSLYVGLAVALVVAALVALILVVRRKKKA